METTCTAKFNSQAGELRDISLRKLLNQYEVLRTLGRGTHGKVELARNVKTKQLVAIKSMKRKNKEIDRYAQLAENARNRDPQRLPPVNKVKTNEKKIRREIAILRRINHPNVVSLIEVLDDPTKKRVHIVMEYLGGGDVEWRTMSREPVQTVLQSTRIIRDVMLGLRYLHIQGIVHRDIKPANLLWSDDHITVKISDFGVSIYEFPINTGNEGCIASEIELEELKGNSFLNRVAGTTLFLAPEVCPPPLTEDGRPIEDTPDLQPSKFALDTWALGVTYYCLLFGHCPWEDKEQWSLLNKIAATDFRIPETMGSDRLKTGGRKPPAHYFDGCGVMTILNGLLTKDPHKRMTLVALKQVPYLTKDIEDLPRWMQETAKQAGDVITVSEVEQQSAIGFVRWSIQSSLEKLRLRSAKAKAKLNYSTQINHSIRSSVPTVSTRRADSDKNKFNSKDSGLAMSAEIKHQASGPPNEAHQVARRVGMHRKVLEAVRRSNDDNRVHPWEASSSPDFSTRIQESAEGRRKRKGTKAVKDWSEDFTLQSAGPSRDSHFTIDVEQRFVVSEGESLCEYSSLDSEGSGYSSSSEDYGETDGDKQRRLFVGAGRFLNPSSEQLRSNANDVVTEAQGSDLEDVDGCSSIYSGSDTSDPPPVEVKRRKPTLS